MDSKYSHADLKNMDSMESPFHQELMAAFGELTDNMTQLVSDMEAEEGTSEDSDALKTGMWEVVERYNYSMQGLDTFLNAIKSESSSLDRELETLEAKKQEILLERDVLIEKGHELNCRLGYNALERKLDESFSSIEKYTNEDSAKCFRDEAEENLKQTNNLIRIANIRACQIDRDTFKEMEKITCLFENYERDREFYVKELDLFTDMRRNKISAWLSDPRMDADREKGENVLDYLNLSQRQRHMEAQIIKNALRMYSFNASLNFDREDNIKMMDELMSLQSKINRLTGANLILPRNARAKTNLTNEDDFNKDENGKGGGDQIEDQEEMRGRGLHRCPRKMNLATDPITDPKLAQQLESALRWEDSDDTPSTSCGPIDNSFSELATNVLTSSSSTMMDAKLTFSLCGDAEAAHMRPPLSDVADDEGYVTKTMSDCCKQMNSIPSTHSFLGHFESSTVLPGSAERQMVGLVRKRHSGRPVGSLTNVMDAGKAMQSHRAADAESEARDTRSQGSEHAAKPTTSYNRSREYVPSVQGSTFEKD
ncbi:unnamed protein product [Lymnaea stagnalis]|uniref:Uncharacterized protein n=1 Tax=Lymnaea stagnalis TaxID=6523 RepID=A0AAV2HWE8_LYMST